VESQLASAGVISVAAALGGPVSTTHVVSSTLMGIGGAERPKAVRWGKAAEIVFTWFITLPAAGLLGSGFYLLLQRLL
jgi:PiT family inorganic phosphate transporter